MSWSNTLIDFAIVIAAVVFMLQYTIRSPWWRNAAGRAVIFLASSIALIPFPKVLWILLGADTHDTTYVWTELICKIPVILALACIVITFERVRRCGLRLRKIKELEDALRP